MAVICREDPGDECCNSLYTVVLRKSRLRTVPLLLENPRERTQKTERALYWGDESRAQAAKPRVARRRKASELCYTGQASYKLQRDDNESLATKFKVAEHSFLVYRY